jgi:hypothetical protein
LTVALAATTALAAGNVTFLLESPQNGQQVVPGANIAWSIKVSVSTADNFGLALFVVDLVQDPNNPAFFDIPPGDAQSIPSAMAGFNRPGGITNPGENGAASGYIGVQRGTAGRKDLIQIGGGQNTFGQAGQNFGTDPNVDGGVGQSGSQLVLSGQFAAPATGGAYTFRLANPVANVLEQLNTPPQFSPVTTATSSVAQGVISFTVSSGPVVCRGDLNCDGLVNFGDINPFVVRLSDQNAYQQQYPNCPDGNGDINEDGVVNFGDISPFVTLLSDPPACP